MNRLLLLTAFLTMTILSCTTSKTTNLEIAKRYYRVLDISDLSHAANVLADSLVIRETAYDYEEVFSMNRYIDWMQWDSLFNPSYDILKIEQENETIKATISKIDDRIDFLHEGPIVSNETLHFENDKIVRVEKSYELFNDAIFIKNREALSNWIDKYHPELNGFLYDQTKDGAIKYLKVLELYRNKK